MSCSSRTDWDYCYTQAFKEVSQLSIKTQDVFRIGSNTDFNGFDFPGFPIHRKNEPDAFIMLRGGQFPLVVLEAGFSERESSLIQDAQLWLHGGCAAAKFVLVVIIMESKSICDDRRSPRRHLKDSEAEELLLDGTAISEGDSIGPEPSTSDQLQFASQLRRLHAEKRCTARLGRGTMKGKYKEARSSLSTKFSWKTNPP